MKWFTNRREILHIRAVPQGDHAARYGRPCAARPAPLGRPRLGASRTGLFASKTLGRFGPSEADYVVWRPGADATQVDAVPGEAHTWCWYVTGDERLYWSHWVKGSGSQVRYSDDGERWLPVPSLAGEFVWDFAELDGRMFVVSPRGVWVSDDGIGFRLLAAAPSRTAFAPVPSGLGINVEATGSLEAWRGALRVGERGTARSTASISRRSIRNARNPTLNRDA